MICSMQCMATFTVRSPQLVFEREYSLGWVMRKLSAALTLTRMPLLVHHPRLEVVLRLQELVHVVQAFPKVLDQQ